MLLLYYLKKYVILFFSFSLKKIVKFCENLKYFHSYRKKKNNTHKAFKTHRIHANYVVFLSICNHPYTHFSLCALTLQLYIKNVCYFFQLFKSNSFQFNSCNQLKLVSDLVVMQINKCYVFAQVQLHVKVHIYTLN